MSKQLKNIQTDKTPDSLNTFASAPNRSKGLIVHKTTSAQRCEICHQSDMFDPQTGECNRCSKLSAHIQQHSFNPLAGETDQALQKRDRFVLIGFILSTALGSLIYKILVWGRLTATDLLLITLPSILAILTSFIPKPKTFTGAIIKGLTIFVLMASIFASAFLGEQTLYILILIPILYVVGSFVGALLDIITRSSVDRPNRPNGNSPLALFPLAFLIINFEAVAGNFSFSNNKINIRISISESK
jgi:hypothetical protein